MVHKHTHTRGVWEHAPPEKFFKLGALRSLLRPYMYSNLYSDSMALEYRAQVFLERRSPCSGIAEPSLHMLQRRGMVKKVTILDSLKGGTKMQILTKGGGGGVRAPGAPPPPPSPRFRRLCSRGVGRTQPMPGSSRGPLHLLEILCKMQKQLRGFEGMLPRKL